MKTLRVSEIFKSIQGEGRYQGIPATFVRLSGCTRSCNFCDTKYHTESIRLLFRDAHKIITKELSPTIIFTGGEPLYQWKQLRDFLNKCYPHAKGNRFHLETNGDLIKNVAFLDELLEYFNYICISPKEERVAKRISKIVKEYKNKFCCGRNNFIDIKVVTDGNNINRGLMNYATMLMPLTTYNKDQDIRNKQRVWDFCVSRNLFYSARLHVEVFGNTRKK